MAGGIFSGISGLGSQTVRAFALASLAFQNEGLQFLRVSVLHFQLLNLGQKPFFLSSLIYFSRCSDMLRPFCTTEKPFGLSARMVPIALTLNARLHLRFGVLFGIVLTQYSDFFIFVRLSEGDSREPPIR